MTAPADRLVSRFGEHTEAAEVIEGIDLSGRTAIVTGGASGIGVATVDALAGAGADVVIAARDVAAADAVAMEINERLGAARVMVELLDLGDLASVHAFAERWEQRPLALLINNAGVMACPFGRTEEGFETQFGINHLGHFLLARLLTPSLVAAAPSRLISLSSAGHRYGGVDFEDPGFAHRAYHPFVAYGQSKTANALFAVEFDRRYRDAGVRAFSVMPGVITTRLGRHMTPQLREEMGFRAPRPASADSAPPIAYKSVAAGAATTVWAATAPELAGHGGLYLEDCAQARPFTPDLPRGKGVMPHALDPDAARRLWTLSDRLVGLDEAG